MITLIPAYGRDYPSKNMVLLDWITGKDFQVALTGQYANLQDIPNEAVRIRYGNLRKVVIVDPKTSTPL